jgi:hypothetical protein
MFETIGNIVGHLTKELISAPVELYDGFVSAFEEDEHETNPGDQPNIEDHPNQATFDFGEDNGQS